MAFVPQPNTCLFDNTRNDKSDLTGDIKIECPKCRTTSGWWVNGWRTISQNGLAYISIALKPKWEKTTASQTANK